MLRTELEQEGVAAEDNPATGEWNDSLTGDHLWSNVNVREAVPDVMTPSTWACPFRRIVCLQGYSQEAAWRYRRLCSALV